MHLEKLRNQPIEEFLRGVKNIVDSLVGINLLFLT